ncbi:unnamed protein product, partial [Owenia fusiformis]
TIARQDARYIRRCSLMVRLLTSQGNLRVNVGEWEGIPMRDRLCELCQHEVETLEHFTLFCPNNNENRTQIQIVINRYLNDEHVTTSNKLKLVYGGDERVSHDELKAMSSNVRDMYIKRTEKN